MFVNKDNSHFPATKFSRRKGVVCKQDGGGYGVTNDSLTQSSNGGLGASRPTLVKYDHCGGVKNPANLGVANIRSQSGGKRKKRKKTRKKRQDKGVEIFHMLTQDLIIPQHHLTDILKKVLH